MKTKEYRIYNLVCQVPVDKSEAFELQYSQDDYQEQLEYRRFSLSKKEPAIVAAAVDADILMFNSTEQPGCYSYTFYTTDYEIVMLNTIGIVEHFMQIDEINLYVVHEPKRNKLAVRIVFKTFASANTFWMNYLMITPDNKKGSVANDFIRNVYKELFPRRL